MNPNSNTQRDQVSWIILWFVCFIMWASRTGPLHALIMGSMTWGGMWFLKGSIESLCKIDWEKIGIPETPTTPLITESEEKEEGEKIGEDTEKTG